MRNIFLTLTAIAGLLLTSCAKEENSYEKIVQNLEKCFKEIKPEDVDKISKEKAIEISKCMLPYLQTVMEKLEKMSFEEREEFEEALTNELKKSRYGEILIRMDYELVEEMANSDEVEQDMEDDFTESSISSKDDDNIDAMLDSYEDYMDEYISYMEKINNGDMDVYNDLPTLMRKGEEWAKKTEKAKGHMTAHQMARMTEILNKINIAISNMN